MRRKKSRASATPFAARWDLERRRCRPCCTGGRCCMWIAAARWKSKTAGASCSTMPKKLKLDMGELSVTIEGNELVVDTYQKKRSSRCEGRCFSIHFGYGGVQGG